MISRIKGRVVARHQDYIIVDIGNIGVKVYVPSKIMDDCFVGETVSLHTHLHVRENELTLYGTRGEEDLELFELLLGVNGVGPRLALGILSASSMDALRRAVSQEQPDLLARIPGVGKRTAEKIIFHLKNRLPATDEFEDVARLTSVDTEVVEALTSLGYSLVEAQRAVQGLPPDVTDVEERLRLALSSFNT